MKMYGVNNHKAIVLYVLVEWHEPISSQMITEISEKNQYEVSQILREWLWVFKRVQEYEKVYIIYHKSFVDFLKSKDELGQDQLYF